jgi:cob(I)alamin adenosyltransferase
VCQLHNYLSLLLFSLLICRGQTYLPGSKRDTRVGVISVGVLSEHCATRGSQIMTSKQILRSILARLQRNIFDVLVRPSVCNNSKQRKVFMNFDTNVDLLKFAKYRVWVI